MALKSLNQLRELRRVLGQVRAFLLRARIGLKIEEGTEISFSSRLQTRRRGYIVIGKETLVAFKTLLITRDFLTGVDAPIRIGDRCFIGGGSIILPGVVIGDGSIVGAGSVVFDDVPPGSIVAGNPARLIRSGIEVGPRGRLAGADENTRRLWNP